MLLVKKKFLGVKPSRNASGLNSSKLLLTPKGDERA